MNPRPAPSLMREFCNELAASNAGWLEPAVANSMIEVAIDEPLRRQRSQLNGSCQTGLRRTTRCTREPIRFVLANKTLTQEKDEGAIDRRATLAAPARLCESNHSPRQRLFAERA